MSCIKLIIILHHILCSWRRERKKKFFVWNRIFVFGHTLCCSTQNHFFLCHPTNISFFYFISFFQQIKKNTHLNFNFVCGESQFSIFNIRPNCILSSVNFDDVQNSFFLFFLKKMHKNSPHFHFWSFLCLCFRPQNIIKIKWIFSFLFCLLLV